MTLENDSTPVQPTKPARRRVTRTTAAPKIEPVQFLKAEPAQEAAPKTTVGHAQVVSGAQASDTPAAPRRSRRVVSSGKATTTSVAVSGTATQIAQQATEANERAQQESVSATAPAATGTVQATGTEEAAAPKKRSTTAKNAGSKKATNAKKSGASATKAAKNADTSETQAEAQPQLDVFGELDESAKKPAKRGGKKRAEKPVEQSPAATPEVATQETTSQDEPAGDNAAEPRTANRTRNRRRATTTRELQNSEVQDTEASEAPQTPEKTDEPKRSAARTGNSRTRSRKSNVFSDAQTGVAEEKPATETAAPARPRLATTALLFQAPDLSTVPARSAGAQITEPDVEDTEEVETEEEVEAAEETQETTARTARRDRGRNRNRNNRSTEATEDSAEPVAQEEAPQANTDTTDEDTDDDSDTDSDSDSPRRRRRRGGRGRRNRSSSDNADSSSQDESDDSAEQESTDEDSDNDSYSDNDEYSSTRRRRRRRRTRGSADDSDSRTRTASDEVTALKGSTRLEAKRQRRREGRDAGRRRTIITEAEFLARRESVERSMVVRERNGRTQIAVLEDGVLVEHYVSQQSQASMAGNVYLGRVQNVLPSMEAAFVDIGKGRNAVLYAGEVNWDIHGVDGQPRRIEDALKSGDSVLVQVTKDPIGHKGARLTSQVTLAGRYLVFVPGGGMTGISRKLPDTERNRLKRILREVVPEGAGVIVRTAAEGASEEELTADIERLRTQWEAIEKKSKTANAPALLQGEPDLAIRVVRDIFNDDFTSLKVQGDGAWNEISEYVKELAPDLADRVSRWTSEKDIFGQARIDEQLTKGMDRKVWLPSGGSLVIDRTEAMTVIDVNTGKFTGAGGTLEETVTRNNLEAAEEIVRQLRLRDIGGIIVIDFIDMVLESNRDLVLRRLVECLGRDRTKHQVAEVTSLGLVQMTRKRVGQGLVEAFSTTCDHCNGRGFVVHEEPNEKQGQHAHNNSPVVSGGEQPESKRSRRKRSAAAKEATEQAASTEAVSKLEGDKEARDAVKAKLATIAAAAAHAHTPEDGSELEDFETDGTVESVEAEGTETEAPAESVEPAAEAQAAEVVETEVVAAEAVETEVATSEVAKEPAPVVEPTNEASEASDTEASVTESSDEEVSVNETSETVESATDEANQVEEAPENSANVPVLDVLAEFGFKDSGKN